MDCHAVVQVKVPEQDDTSIVRTLLNPF
jgi:hypothetical protein